MRWEKKSIKPAFYQQPIVQDNLRWGFLFPQTETNPFIDVYAQKFSIGSSPNCQFVLEKDSSKISTVLLRLTNRIDQSKMFLEVHGQNGEVFLNEKLIRRGHKIAIKDGDHITIRTREKNYRFLFLTVRFAQQHNSSNEERITKSTEKFKEIDQAILETKRKISKKLNTLLEKARFKQETEKQQGTQETLWNFQYPLDFSILEQIRNTATLNLISPLMKKEIQFPNQQSKVLFLGPSGSQILQQRLGVAIANSFNAQNLTVGKEDFGVFTKKKGNEDIRERIPNLPVMFKVGDIVKYIGSRNYANTLGEETTTTGPSPGDRGVVVVTFDNNLKSPYIGVQFQKGFPGGSDLGGICLENNTKAGYFVNKEEVSVLDDDLIDLPALAMRTIMSFIKKRQAKEKEIELKIKNLQLKKEKEGKMELESKSKNENEKEKGNEIENEIENEMETGNEFQNENEEKDEKDNTKGKGENKDNIEIEKETENEKKKKFKPLVLCLKEIDKWFVRSNEAKQIFKNQIHSITNDHLIMVIGFVSNNNFLKLSASRDFENPNQISGLRNSKTKNKKSQTPIASKSQKNPNVDKNNTTNNNNNNNNNNNMSNKTTTNNNNTEIANSTTIPNQNINNTNSNKANKTNNVNNKNIFLGSKKPFVIKNNDVKNYINKKNMPINKDPNNDKNHQEKNNILKKDDNNKVNSTINKAIIKKGTNQNPINNKNKNKNNSRKKIPTISKTSLSFSKIYKKNSEIRMTFRFLLEQLPNKIFLRPNNKPENIIKWKDCIEGDNLRIRANQNKVLFERVLDKYDFQESNIEVEKRLLSDQKYTEEEIESIIGFSVLNKWSKEIGEEGKLNVTDLKERNENIINNNINIDSVDLNEQFYSTIPEFKKKKKEKSKRNFNDENENINKDNNNLKNKQRRKLNVKKRDPMKQKKKKIKNDIKIENNKENQDEEQDGNENGKKNENENENENDREIIPFNIKAQENENREVINTSDLEYGIKLFSKLSGRNQTSQLIENLELENDYEKQFLSEVIAPEKIGVHFDDVGALEHVKNTLIELVILPLKRPELFQRGNLVKACKGILLFGPPGTGKTMLAKAVATESGANFINVSMTKISSKWFGEGEKYAKAVFTLAIKLAPSIIFIDEVDSFLNKRQTSHEHEASRKIKNTFMEQWDGLESGDTDRVIVLAATNRPFDLDEAVLRRLPRRLFVNMPNKEAREQILRTLLQNEELEKDFDFEKLAEKTEGYSGSDLKNLCITAAYEPIRDLLYSESGEKKKREMKKKKENEKRKEKEKEKEEGKGKEMCEEKEKQGEKGQGKEDEKTKEEEKEKKIEIEIDLQKGNEKKISITVENKNEKSNQKSKIKTILPPPKEILQNPQINPNFFTHEFLRSDINDDFHQINDEQIFWGQNQTKEKTKPAKLREVTFKDFLKVMESIGISVSDLSFTNQQLKRWNERYGEGRTPDRTYLPYFH
ncbi:aaa-type atpase family protein-related [Anaeramoeba flamelloides]|uniref:Aaa-type atpase family protein-related n=1 Tax=Anaeramoeba flamelloides TaxID=1746091 RepID=A0AAV7YRQ1_9EUKA|nr:aaa-type atpase family protein-related [Anaeramoeba flamelloides]